MPANPNKARIARQVDAMFKADLKSRFGYSKIPVIGGHYVPGEEDDDYIKHVKKLVRGALFAREWFAENGPMDAQPLPLDTGGVRCARDVLNYIVELYARSLSSLEYDVAAHPPFADYVSGVLWEAGRGRIGVIPKSPHELAALKKRYPPRELVGIGHGFCWKPPERDSWAFASSKHQLATHGHCN